MKNIFTLITSLFLFFNVYSQTIKDSIFYDVYLIKEQNITKNGNDLFIDINIKNQKEPVVIYNSDRNIPLKVFCERETFSPKQNEFILITPDWEFQKKIRETEKTQGIHIKAEKHKFYNIKRTINTFKIDSLSRSIYDVRNPIKLNFKEITPISSGVNFNIINNDFTFIIGKWREIEYHGNNGANDYITKIENGQSFTFETNGTVIIEKDNIKNAGKYEVSHHNKYFDKLHISSQKNELFYFFSIQKDNIISLTPVTYEYHFFCDEGCEYVYEKIK